MSKVILIKGSRERSTGDVELGTVSSTVRHRWCCCLNCGAEFTTDEAPLVPHRITRDCVVANRYCPNCDSCQVVVHVDEDP